MLRYSIGGACACCQGGEAEGKKRQNRRKHGVDFEAAALVFDDPNHRKSWPSPVMNASLATRSRAGRRKTRN
jgi:hypothetical protein